MIIDMHTHTFPEKIAARAIAGMERASRMSACSDGLPETLTRSMRASGVYRSVLLPVATNVIQPGKLNRLAVEIDRHTGETGQIAFGAMHPDDPDWKSQLRFLHENGVRGIKLHPMYQGVALDDIRYMRIVGEAARYDMLVTVHMGEDIGVPGPALGTPENALRLQKETGARGLILAHLGGWKLWDRVLDCLVGAPVYMDTAFCFGETTVYPPDPRSAEERRLGETGQLLRIIRAHGTDRILFGSDSPWTDPAAEIRKLRELPLSEQDLDRILGGNAARLLGMGE